MADNQSTSAKNSLGQLFVEFGAKGLGGLVNGLNKVSAQFLLTKNAAKQAITPLVNFYKNAGDSMIQLEKQSLVTNIPLKQLIQTKRNLALSEADYNKYVSNIINLQQTLLDAFQGRNPQAMLGLSNLGISDAFMKSDPLHNPLKSIELVKNAIVDLYNTGNGPLALNGARLLGLGPEDVWTFVQANKEADKTLQLTDAQYKAIENERYAMLELQDAWNQFLLKAMATEDVVEITKDLVEVIKKLFHSFDDNKILHFMRNWADLINNTNNEWTNFKSNIKETFPWLFQIWKILDKINAMNSNTSRYLENAKAFEDAKSNLKPGAGNITYGDKGLINPVGIGAFPQGHQSHYNQQVVYNVTNNNSFNAVEDLLNVDYIQELQLKHNVSKGANRSGR